MQARIAHIAPEFRPREHHIYPEKNDPSFEEWFYQNYSIQTDTVERYYLPVWWTAYLKNNNYAQDKESIIRLQNVINGLPKDRKYWSCCQYDDGPIVDLSGIDIKMFSMAGEPNHYTLPLICHPHSFRYPTEKRDIFCSFIGRMTHPLRIQLLGAVSKVRNDHKDYYISSYPHPTSEYCRILSKSVFSLCPRGYSANSFRIMESMQYGAIPVWISDKFLIPHKIDFEEFGVLIKPDEIYRIDKILNGFSDMEIYEKHEAVKHYYENYYTFKKNKALIIKNLKDELA